MIELEAAIAALSVAGATVCLIRIVIALIRLHRSRAAYLTGATHGNRDAA